MKLSPKCMIIGCGAHASAVISFIESSKEKYEIIGLVDTAQHYDDNEEVSGYKVLTTLNLLLESPSSYTDMNFFIAIGDNKYREVVFEMLMLKKFNLPNVISKTAFIDRNATMGCGNVIAHGAIINSHVTLGNNNIINTGSIIEHDGIIGNHVHIAPGAVICGNVTISNNVFIGAGVTVIPSVFIAHHTNIGAGAVLTSNINNPNLTFVGVPAKELSK
jgi:sugar O-acyltransferase (sialic acid O-acetyltransferase NeuD family)